MLDRLRPGLSVEATVETRGDAPAGRTRVGLAATFAMSPDTDRASLRQWLAVAARDPGRLHGHSGHPDHQFVAERHRGRARRLVGRGKLDLDRLPDGRDHRDPADRLARVHLRPAPLSRGQHRALHRLLARLRDVDESARDDPVPRRPGFHGRRPDPPPPSPSCAPACRSPSRAVGIALFGLTATFAPAIGPTVGGWLTDNLSWHYIFYLNLVPGPLALALQLYALDPAPLRLGELAKGDWLGVGLMATGLPALTFVLEEGAAEGLVRLAHHRRGCTARRARHRRLHPARADGGAALHQPARAQEPLGRGRLPADDRSGRGVVRARSTSSRSIVPRSRATTPSRSAMW